jgi:DNA-binding CsgD family transcriptional regulator
MYDVAIVFSLISIFISVASISVSFVINQNYQKKALDFFIGFIFSFFLLQNSITLINYAARVDNPAGFILCLSKILDLIGTPLSSYFGLLFVNALLGKRVATNKKRIIIIISALQFAGILVINIFPIDVLKLIIKISILLVILYEMLLILVSYKEIANEELKKALKILIGLSILFVPLFAFEAFRYAVPSLSEAVFLKVLSLPAFCFAINLFTLFFSFQYFNSPAFMENNQLTEYFICKYGITRKEVEIIELLLNGCTYARIAEKLYITNKTVDNHIQNIYKKLKVTSKIQLFNLVRSNEK